MPYTSPFFTFIHLFCIQISSKETDTGRNSIATLRGGRPINISNGVGQQV